MDRNSIIGILIIATIFIVFTVINKPSAEEREKARQEYLIDSTARANRAAERENIVRETDRATEYGESQTMEADIDPQAETTEYRSITIENDVIRLKLSEKGGKPVSVELKKYLRYDATPVYLFDEDSSRFGLDFAINNRPFNTSDLFFSAQTNQDSIIIDENSPGSVAMRYYQNDNSFIEYRYTLSPERYLVNMDITFSGMQNISTSGTERIDLKWKISSPQQERGRENEMQYTTLYYKPLGDDVEFFRPKKNTVQKQNFTTRLEWIAYKDQFFSSVLMGKNVILDADMQSETKPENSRYLKEFSSTIGLLFERSPEYSMNLDFYFGPNKYKLLKKHYKEEQLHELVTVGRGIIKWINQIMIIGLFDFLNRFILNYGIIILVMTIIIKLFLLPLTYKSYLSTAKMRVLKPQIDEINAKIPKDKPMERQQATMALYKKVGVSPLGGCLPMLLQMPILFAMFRFFPTSIELRQESFLWAKDLSTYDAILEWSAHIPLISDYFGNHLSLFTLLMTISTIISMKYTNQSTAGTQQMPGMQTMMYIMPVMFMFILNKFSSGLTYYYFLTNIISIGQNILFKSFVDEEKLLKKLESKKTKAKTKSSFQKRLEDMAKQKGYKPRKK